VLPSVNVPFARKLVLVFAAIDALGGATAIDTSAAGATVSSVFPVTFEYVAETVAVPCAFAAASPGAEIFAAVVSELIHAAAVVRSFVLPSLNCPVAWNCCASPAATEGLLGLICMDIRFT